MPANQMIQTITKTRKTKKKIKKKITDDNKSEKEQKTPGIGTELYVYKEDELTEEDQAEITQSGQLLREACLSHLSFKYRRSKDR